MLEEGALDGGAVGEQDEAQEGSFFVNVYHPPDATIRLARLRFWCLDRSGNSFSADKYAVRPIAREA